MKDAAAKRSVERSFIARIKKGVKVFVGAKSLFCCGDFTPFPRKRKTFISCGNAIF